MMSSMAEITSYRVLLNDELKQEIIRLPEHQKTRLREKLEFLEQGIWDSGLRVKKLKGPKGKVIFEARISKGDRLIFTLGKDKEETCIYIWAAVHHDGISRTSRNIFPGNAPFLQFDPISDEPLDDLMIDDLNESCFTQESLECEVADDYGPQKWLVIDAGAWKRLLKQKSSGSFEMPLYLTVQQRELIDSKPPLLLSGTAGSGKTTMLVYILLKEAAAGKSTLFLTCSRQLRDFSSSLFVGLTSDTEFEHHRENAQFYVLKDLILDILKRSGISFDAAKEVGFQEFQNIFSNHSLSRSYDAELVWEEIRSIIKGAHPSLQQRILETLIRKYSQGTISMDETVLLQHTLLDLQNFELIEKIQRYIYKKTQFGSFELFIQHLGDNRSTHHSSCPAILDEIVHIVHSQAKQLHNPMLTYKEYLKLGKKRAPNFIYDREEVYSIAQYYQAKLEEQQRYDELDLCRKAVEMVDRNREAFVRDTVICDEIQDFSDIQMSLIFRLARNPSNLVCAGDPKQIINPSGFRWEELKQRFYERGIPVPPVTHLNLNFRCSGSIVDLANSLLDLKSRLIGLTSHEQRERWKFKGRPPFLVWRVSEHDMLVSAKHSGAGRIILVRSEDGKRYLKKHLGTELVFTIHEAKGLEFDTVLLWKFSDSESSAGIWRKISAEQFLDQAHHPIIRHEINLLYVAVTRSRNTLIIYDGTAASPVWGIPELQDRVFMTDEKSVLSELWKQVSSSQEWEQQGDYFFEREYYPAAMECYRNADNPEKADLCRAYILSQEKHHLEAAELFASSGMKELAANEYMSGGDWKKARKLWKALGNAEQEHICRIRWFEESGNFLAAGDAWAEKRQYTLALKNWLLARAYRKAAELMVKQKKYLEAAELFEKDKDILSAAGYYKKAKQLKKAAELYTLKNDYPCAFALYKRLKDTENMISCLSSMKEYYQLALLQEKLKRYDDAVKSFEVFAQLSGVNRRKLIAEAESFVNTRKNIRAALRYSAVSKTKTAGELFEQARHYSLGAAEYRKISDWIGAARCSLKEGNYREAAEFYEQAGEHQRAVKVLADKIFEPYNYNKDLAKSICREADTHFRDNDYNRALTRYIASHCPEGVLDSAKYIKHRDEEILGYFIDYQQFDVGHKYLDARNSLSVSEAFLDRIIGNHKFPIHHAETGTKYGLIAHILLQLCSQDSGLEITQRVWKFLELIYYIDLSSEKSGRIAELVLKSEHCNSIHFLISTTLQEEHERFLQFIKDARRKAELSRNPVFKAAVLGPNNPEFNALLDGAQCDQHNYRVFSVSSRHYQKAVDLTEGQGEIGYASFILKNHNRHTEAAQLLERNGKHKKAAELYRDLGNYDQALRVYAELGSQDGIARVYEKMNRFEDALCIWKNLGRKRDISRVEKKIGGHEGVQQQELF